MTDAPDRTIYRTTNERVVALEAKRREAMIELSAKRNAFLAEFAPEGAGAMVRNDGINGKRMVGISLASSDRDLDADTPPPAGWRWKSGENWLVPDKRRALGKRVQAAMHQVRHQGFARELIGMPSDYVDGGLWHWPGVEFHDEAAYVVWAKSGPSTDEIDLAIWEPVKLSEWYRIKEGESA